MSEKQFLFPCGQLIEELGVGCTGQCTARSVEFVCERCALQLASYSLWRLLNEIKSVKSRKNPRKSKLDNVHRSFANKMESNKHSVRSTVRSAQALSRFSKLESERKRKYRPVRDPHTSTSVIAK